MKQKLGDLKGEKVGAVDFPGMAKGPTLEPIPDPKSDK
jgi:hypothetical protein